MMTPLDKEIFICLDCESTGLDPKEDEIIEVAAKKFTFKKELDSFETLIQPTKKIPEASIEIHHITDDMVAGKPKIKTVLPSLFQFIENYPIVGHGILFDLQLLHHAAQNALISSNLLQHPYIDTLRLARLYGECSINSLEKLRSHFNIPAEGAHRAMNDVIVNIEVFKHLSKKFATKKQLMERLQKPIRLKAMPLGKHKFRPFPEIPIEYLKWAAKQNFDQDLLYSIHSELKRRKKGDSFHQAANPFSSIKFD